MVVDDHNPRTRCVGVGVVGQLYGASLSALPDPGHPQPDFGPSTRRAADVRRTTEVADSPANRVADSQPALGSGLGEPSVRDTRPVVANGHTDRRALVVHENP